MLDPAEVDQRKTSEVNAREKYNQNFGQLNMTDPKVYLSLFEIFWYSQLPCFDVRNITSDKKDATSTVKRCYWNGERMNCSDIFKTQPTDRGMCCTFNMEAAEKVYKESKYTEALTKMREQDQNLSFTEERNTTLKGLKPRAGMKKGLKVILDLHRDLVSSGTVSDDFRGFVASVNAPNEFPMTTENAILIRPGQTNTVGITAVKVQADDDIRNYEPEKRDCYFEDEYPLKIHKRYSRRNCYLECSLDYSARMTERTENFTKCIPWFYPVNDEIEMKMCDPWEAKAFQEFMGTVPEEECKKCLPDCQGNIYDAKVTSTSFEKCDHTNLGANTFCDLEAGDMNPSIWSQEARDEFQDKMKEVPKYLPNITNMRFHVPNPNKRKNVAFPPDHLQYDAFEKDIAFATFYFESREAIQFNRNSANTWYGFISQVGGNAGLGIGFSLISAVELIYWLTVRFLQNYYAQGEAKK